MKFGKKRGFTLYPRALSLHLRKGGFTLIELLIVIAIIGILAAVIIMNLGKAQRRAVDATIKRNLGSLQTQSYVYSQDHGLSYIGFCAAPKATDVMSKVDELNLDGASECRESTDTWASSAYLRTAGTFCVDSSGQSMVNGAINASGLCEYDASLADVQGGDSGGGAEQSADTVVKLGGGFTHACAIFAGGVTKCWGKNYYGQLGDGNHGSAYDSDTPVEVTGEDTYVDISVGGSHTCGVISSGIVKCWGRNNAGQLGVSGINYSDEPVEIDIGGNYTKISAGNYSTCGLTTSGQVKCWGQSWNGHIGKVVSGIDTYIDISVGHSMACGVTNSHEIKCWGKEYHQNFGNGPDHSDNYSTPQLALGGDSWAKVAAHGGLHTCGLTTSGQVKCWGYNSRGYLGTGNTISYDVPTDIDDNSTYSDIKVLYEESCGITTSGIVKCWGTNQFGKSAQGATTGFITSPAVINGGLTFSQINGWSESMFGITPAGEMKIWGRNGVGEMNNATPVDVFAPST